MSAWNSIIHFLMEGEGSVFKLVGLSNIYYLYICSSDFRAMLYCKYDAQGRSQGEPREPRLPPFR